MKKLILVTLFVICAVPLFSQSNVKYLYVGESYVLELTAGHYYGDDYDIDLSSDALDLVSKKNTGGGVVLNLKAARAGKCVVSFTYYYDAYGYPRSYTSDWIFHVTNGTLYLSATPQDGLIKPGEKLYLNAVSKGYQHSETPITDCNIYYTLDGSKPEWYSEKYTSSGIVVNNNCTIKAYASKNGYNDSPLFSQEIVIANGDGTLSNPYDFATVNQKAKGLNTNEKTTESYYFKGKVSSILYMVDGIAKFQFDNDEENNGNTFGGVEYDDNGGILPGTYKINNFYVYSAGYENTPWRYNHPSLREGDNVVVCGKLCCESWSFYGTVEGETYLYALNGFIDESGNSTCASLVHSGVNGHTYRIKGKVKSITNELYGNWYLEDETGEILVYGTKNRNGESGNNYALDYWGLNVGDEITIEGTFRIYNNSVSLNDVTIVSVKNKEIEVAFSPAGYATFYDSRYSFTLPSDVKAYVVTGVTNNKLSYKMINGNVIPKGTAVMLENRGNKQTSIVLTYSENAETYQGANFLQGSDVETITMGDGCHYKLSYGHTGTQSNDVIGWYWGTQNGAPFPIEPNKAWLVVPNGYGTRAMSYTIDDEAAGIEENIVKPITDDLYFDLQGRRISKPTKRGLYIMNGRMIINK